VASYDGVGESLSMLVCRAKDGDLCIPDDPTVDPIDEAIMCNGEYVSSVPLLF
jgi:hypothetical protein